MKQVADRIRWTVDLLEAAPSDLILEIGCGTGAAVSLICGRLRDGMVTAVDQSKKMILAARKKNAEHESAGKVRFVAAKFHEADLGESRLHKVFAINVNVFWQNPARELHPIRERLLPGGTLYLVNQPPALGKIRVIEERTTHHLTAAGFDIRQIVVGEQKPVPALRVIARCLP